MNAELLEDIKIALMAMETLLLEGEPGIGKSASIISFCEWERGMKGYVFTPSQRNPEDLLGLPWINKEKGTTEYLPPAWLEQLWEWHRAGIPTYLFLDEMNTAGGLMEAGMLRTLQERVVGEKPLPPDTFLIAACNPSEYAANGHELTAPTANRFTHIRVKFTSTDFIANFPGYWGNPPKVNGLDPFHWYQARQKVAHFIASQTTLLLKFPELESERSKAWPSPRTWTKASKYLAACHGNYLRAQRLVTGAVGENAAQTFFTWYGRLDLIPAPQVFANPRGLEVNKKRMDNMFAILCNCFDWLKEKENFNKKNWLTFWEILDIVAEAGLSDVSCVWFQRMVDLHRELLKQGPVSFPNVAIKRYRKLLEAAKIELT